MSNFYVRSILHGRYATFSNSNASDDSTTSIAHSEGSSGNGSDTSLYEKQIANNTTVQQLEDSTVLPGSISSPFLGSEKQKNVAVEASFSIYRSLPDTDLNPNPSLVNSPCKYNKISADAPPTPLPIL